MPNPDWEKGGKSPNPKGRGKGRKQASIIPVEVRRMLSKVNKANLEAIDILIEKMVQTLPDGTVVKNEKVAKEIIQIWFQTKKLEQELENRYNKAAAAEEIVPEESKPKFSLTVINPTTKDKVNISGE